MSQIPANEVTQADLNEWYNLQQELGKLKSKEQLLRTKIFAGKFPNPVEGTNTFDLADGWKLKGKHTINRTVDEAAFKAMAEEFAKQGIATDRIVRYKPELVLSEYRSLTAEQQAQFDNALIVKPGMPGLEIMLPKRRGKGE